jgi:hypothetical protein
LWDGGRIKHFFRATLTQMAKDQGFEFAAFECCGEGLRSFPFLWSGMLMIFRKPLNRRSRQPTNFDSRNLENQPHALGYATGETLWSENAERETVPVTGDAER